MNMQEFIQRIDYQQPIVFRMLFANLTPATPNTDSQQLNIGAQSVFIDRIFADGTAVGGAVLFDGDFSAQDWIYASLKDNKNHNYFDNTITLKALNKIGLNPNFKGWIFPKFLELTMDLTVAAIPVVPILVNIRVMVHFSGYKLID